MKSDFVWTDWVTKCSCSEKSDSLQRGWRAGRCVNVLIQRRDAKYRLWCSLIFTMSQMTSEESSAHNQSQVFPANKLTSRLLPLLALPFSSSSSSSSLSSCLLLSLSSLLPLSFFFSSSSSCLLLPLSSSPVWLYLLSHSGVVSLWCWASLGGFSRLRWDV